MYGGGWTSNARDCHWRTNFNCGLGGWNLHASVTGQIDAFTDNEDNAIQLMKEFFSYMPSCASEEPPFVNTGDDPYRRVENVTEIVPTKRNRAYDMKKLISRDSR